MANCPALSAACSAAVKAAGSSEAPPDAGEGESMSGVSYSIKRCSVRFIDSGPCDSGVKLSSIPGASTTFGKPQRFSSQGSVIAAAVLRGLRTAAVDSRRLHSLHLGRELRLPPQTPPRRSGARCTRQLLQISRFDCSTSAQVCRQAAPSSSRNTAGSAPQLPALVALGCLWVHIELFLRPTRNYLARAGQAANGLSA